MDDEWEFWEHNYHGNDSKELSRSGSRSNGKQFQGILAQTNKPNNNDQKILNGKTNTKTNYRCNRKTTQ